MFEYSGFLPLPVAVLVRGTFVVLFLTFGQSDFELCAAFRPVQVERHDGVTLAFDLAREPVELLPVHQQFATAGRVCLDVG